jgi:biotin transport system substrate-specific component
MIRSSSLRAIPALPLIAGICGVAVITASAQVQLPMVPVPMTLQTLAVLLIGALAGARIGAASAAAYMGLGIAGLPVFAGWKAAPGALFLSLPTGGYIVGFVLGAALAGWIVARYGRSLLSLIAAFTLGHAVIFAAGVSWLAAFTGWHGAIALGLLPFLLGTVVKIGLGSAFALAVGPRLHRAA